MMSRPHHVPRSIGVAAEAVLAARGQSKRLARVFHRSPVPMVLVDGECRCVEVNGPARLFFRLSLANLRTLRVEDLTPPGLLPTIEAAGARMVATGSTAGPSVVVVPDGSRFEVVYHARANARPGLHVIAFAPAGWAEEDLGLLEADAQEPSAGLTARERDVLELAARGCTGPQIAGELVLSPTTVKTHFANIYAKLGVTGRAAAVAKAIRLGLID